MEKKIKGSKPKGNPNNQNAAVSPPIVFSPVLRREISHTINMIAQDIGEEQMEDAEQTVSDFLSGKPRAEYEALVKVHGWEAVTKAIKKMI